MALCPRSLALPGELIPSGGFFPGAECACGILWPYVDCVRYLIVLLGASPFTFLFSCKETVLYAE